MSKYTGNFRTIQTIKANEDGSLPTEIEVLPMGEWNTLPYGPFKVTAEHFRQMIANFNAGIRKDVPVDVDHDGGRAAGWVKELIASGDRLLAKVEWTTYGEDLLKNKIYKLFSPEFSLNYVDPEYSTDHGAVFIAGSLTNRPLFKELSYITASEKPLTNDSGVVLLFSQHNMNLEELRTKTKEKLTTEEADFLKEHVAELSDEEKTKFELVDETDEAKKKEEEEAAAKQAEADKAEAEKKEAEAKAQADIEASEKAKDSVTISASEYAEYKKAQEELTVKKAEDKIQTFVANDNGGKILPKNKDIFVSFYLKCSDEQKTEFEALINALPEINLAGEIGKDENKTLTATEEIQAKVQEKIKASETTGKKIGYSEALNLVTKENPDLAKRHREESKNQ